MAGSMTDEEKRAVAERLYAAHYLPPRDGATPLVSGLLRSGGTVALLTFSEVMPYRQWPSEESFVRWAADLGVECDVREDFGDGKYLCSAVAFPDGEVAELGRFNGRLWPGVEAFLEEMAGRSCCVYRWRPAPGGETARTQERNGQAMAPRRRADAEKAGARPGDADVALRLRGTSGRMFDRQKDGQWLDTETGAVGAREVLERAWLDSGAAGGR